jgi:hypothetical protein
MVAIVTRRAGPAGRNRTHRTGHNRGRLLPVRCQPLLVLPARTQADGLYRLSGRIPRRREDAQSIIMSPGAAQLCTVTQDDDEGVIRGEHVRV